MTLLARWRAWRSPFDKDGKWKRQTVGPGGPRLIETGDGWLSEADGRLRGPFATKVEALATPEMQRYYGHTTTKL